MVFASGITGPFFTCFFALCERPFHAGFWVRILPTLFPCRFCGPKGAVLYIGRPQPAPCACGFARRRWRQARSLQLNEQYSAVARFGANMVPQIEHVVCGRGSRRSRPRARFAKSRHELEQKRWGCPPLGHGRNDLPHFSQCRSCI
jgi:hypothetical protein